MHNKISFAQALKQYWSQLTVSRLTRTFLTGLIAVLPLMVTFAVVSWLIKFAGGMVSFLVPEDHWLSGILMLIAIIFVVGLLMQAVFFRESVKWLEEQLERVPLIKTVYSAVRDLMSFMGKNDKRKFSQVVLVQVPDIPIRLLGFVTVEDLSKVGLDQGDGSVAVYMPMSYQIGGYTLILPTRYLTPVNMGMEDAMRFLITAGLSRTEESQPPK